MKKKLSTTILSILLLTTFSCCQSDDSIKTDKEYLIGIWKVKKIKTYGDLNGELVIFYERIFDNEPYNKLTFYSNQNVTYRNLDLIEMINGKWTLNGKNLKTDLKLDLPITTGFGTKYFFPESDIIKINDTELILKSPIGNLYTETFFEK